MKRSVLSFILICTVVGLIVVSASGVARACVTYMAAVDGNSGSHYFCSNTGEDARWCYYDCTCWGDCDQLYAADGLIDP
jgi:hypothetical protein